MSFDQFWAAYPRKVGKLAARKAYEKALKLTDADSLLKGATSYATYVAQKGLEARYICHAATWLNQGRWMDEESAHDEPSERMKHRATHAGEDRSWENAPPLEERISPDKLARLKRAIRGDFGEEAAE